MMPEISREMENLSTALLDLKWQEMDNIASQLAGAIDDAIESKLEMDPRYFSQLLSELAEGVQTQKKENN